jgi:hypothetical protein
VGNPKTERKRVEANEIRAALDSTLGSLQSGVQRLGIEAALPVIEGWEGRLAASGDPELEPVAENLGALRWPAFRWRRRAGHCKTAPIVPRDQVQRLANSDIQIEVADKLPQLSVLLTSEDDSLSSE